MKAKPGDLVTPLTDYKQQEALGVVFTPFTPDTNTVCTVAWVNNGMIAVAEVRAHYNGHAMAFSAEYWRVLPPVEVDWNSLLYSSPGSAGPQNV